MNGTELITYLTENALTITSAVGPIVGSILTAVFLRSNTSTTEFEKVKAGKFDEVVEELLASGQMTYTEFYKAKNFLKIAQKADKYKFKKLDLKQNKIYDFDWFIRYYEAAGNISDESMQDIWAKLLAGEIDNPSTYSLRIIDVLRNMRKEEAELFSKLCKYSFMSNQDQIFLPYYKNYLKKCNISYEDIMQLSEIGLIYNDGMLTLESEVSLEPDILFTNKELIMTMSTNNENNNKVEIRQFPFTKVGTELATFVSDMASDDSFIEFAKGVKEDTGFNVGIHKVIQYDEFKIEYDDTDLLN